MNNEAIEIVTSESLSMINRAEIDMQIATAKKYPRSIKSFLNEALEMSTRTTQVAEECHYALPRKEGGQTKMIEGASARFAEVIASAWGNCRAGARVVAEDKDFITAQGVFHDLEKNVAITYEVKRRITGRTGNRFTPDMIAVTGNAASSIALRNAILKGIPKAFWSSVYDAARKTAMGDAKTLVNRRSDALAYFKKLGVEDAVICNTLGVNGIEDIGLEELTVLSGIRTAIKDGDITVESAFARENQRAENIMERFNTAPIVPQPESNPEPKQEAVIVPPAEEPPADHQNDKQYEMYQQCCALIVSVANQKGESPDDYIDTLTKGKVSAMIDLADKPEAFLLKLKIALESELATEGE